MTTTKKWRMLSTLMLTGVMSVWGQLCHADGSLTYTSAVIIDTHTIGQNGHKEWHVGEHRDILQHK